MDFATRIRTAQNVIACFAEHEINTELPQMASSRPSRPFRPPFWSAGRYVYPEDCPHPTFPWQREAYPGMERLIMIREPGETRLYCPRCSKPILDIDYFESGRYFPHCLYCDRFFC